MGFVLGILSTLAGLTFFEVLTQYIGNMRVKVDERKVIQEFCKKRDYCFYGCGVGREGAYYGGWNCKSDHK